MGLALTRYRWQWMERPFQEVDDLKLGCPEIDDISRMVGSREGHSRLVPNAEHVSGTRTGSSPGFTTFQ